MGEQRAARAFWLDTSGLTPGARASRPRALFRHRLTSWCGQARKAVGSPTSKASGPQAASAEVRQVLADWLCNGAK
jgi:hypothetical protein